MASAACNGAPRESEAADVAPKVTRAARGEPLTGPIVEVCARVLRRRPKASGLLFLDVMLPPGESEAEPREAQLVLSVGIEGGPSLEDVAAVRADVKGGDAVRAVGRWDTELRGGFYAQRVEVLEPFATAHGEVMFNWSAPEYGADALPAGTAPPLSLVLQCSAPQATRLAEYCREMRPGVVCGVCAPQHKSPDRAILARLPPSEDLAPYVRQLTEDANVHMVLRRIFVVQPPVCLTLERAIERLAELIDAAGNACLPRVQAYPRYLEQRLVAALSEGGRQLEIVRFTHVASLVYTDAMYVVGLAARDVMVSEGADGLDILKTHSPKEMTVSRAYSKLNEALARSRWASELAASPPGLAFDIGASPGGWSLCLASTWGCREVCAVDPGELAPELVAANAAAADAGRQGRIRHIKTGWREALAELQAAKSAVDVLVCDANMPCAQTVDLLAAVSEVLAPRAFVVLTFKNFCKTKPEFEEMKARQLERMREFCSDIRDVQLLANKKECTVLARRHSA